MKYHVLVLWLPVDQIHIPFCDLENVGICVALCRTPGAMGIAWLWFSCSMAIFRQFLVGALRTRCIQSVSSYFLMLHL